MAIYRGTTPAISFKVKFDVSQIEVIYITFKQGSNIKFEKQLQDTSLDTVNNIIIVRLNQEETLSFLCNRYFIYRYKFKKFNK